MESVASRSSIQEKIQSLCQEKLEFDFHQLEQRVDHTKAQHFSLSRATPSECDFVFRVMTLALGCMPVSLHKMILSYSIYAQHHSFGSAFLPAEWASVEPPFGENIAMLYFSQDGRWHRSARFDAAGVAMLNFYGPDATSVFSTAGKWVWNECFSVGSNWVRQGILFVELDDSAALSAFTKESQRLIGQWHYGTASIAISCNYVGLIRTDGSVCKVYVIAISDLIRKPDVSIPSSDWYLVAELDGKTHRAASYEKDVFWFSTEKESQSIEIGQALKSTRVQSTPRPRKRRRSSQSVFKTRVEDNKIKRKK